MAARLEGNDNYGKPRREWFDALAGLTDKEFIERAEKAIWLSAYANNNPRSDYHWQADACYDEAERRGKPQLYEAAYNRASASAQ